MMVEASEERGAKEWGIGWSVVQDEELMSEAMTLATRLSKGATLAFAAQKKQLRAALEMTLEEALDAEAAVQDELIKTNDLKEGIAAFRERRPANYSGS